MMVEIGIGCVIVFAIGYWATLWAAGRREDVLHGQFVEHDARNEPARPWQAPPAAPAALPVGSTVAAAPPQNGKALKSLVVSIRRELNNAAR